MHTCVWPDVVMGKQSFRHTLCDINTVRTRINACYRFSVQQAAFTVVRLRKNFTCIPPLSIKMTTAINFSANGTILNFSFLKTIVFSYSITYHLDSGSKCLTQFNYSKAPKMLIEVHRETRKASDTYILQ